MRYLVCRMEAVRPHGKMQHSDYWPMIVDVPDDIYTHEQVVRKALDNISEGYVGYYEYLCTPLTDAVVVSFRKPTPQYEVVVDRF